MTRRVMVGGGPASSQSLNKGEELVHPRPRSNEEKALWIQSGLVAGARMSTMTADKL